MTLNHNGGGTSRVCRTISELCNLFTVSFVYTKQGPTWSLVSLPYVPTAPRGGNLQVLSSSNRAVRVLCHNTCYIFLKELAATHDVTRVQTLE